MKSVIVKQELVGMIVALVLVSVTYLVADAASGPLIVTQPGRDTPAAVPLGAAVMFTMLGAAAGIGLASIVNRLGRPRSTFVAVAALALYGIRILSSDRASEGRSMNWPSMTGRFRHPTFAPCSRRGEPEDANRTETLMESPICEMHAHRLPLERSSTSRAARWTPACR